MIALIVIAAINPIEQINRARDTRFNSDGAQLVSAIERYYASRQQFPWVTLGGYVNDDDFGFVSATSRDVGICGGNCGADGELITSLELKTEFRKRDFIQKSTGDVTKQIFIGKESGGSSSVYACFIPASKSTREKAVADDQVYRISTSDGSKTVNNSCNVNNWANDCYVCVPE